MNIDENILILLPFSVSFLIMGIILSIFPPKKINGLYGYRTKKSMMNQENWVKAQKYSTLLILLINSLLLVISIILILMSLNFIIQLLLELILIFVSFIFLFFKVEQKLKNHDEKS